MKPHEKAQQGLGLLKEAILGILEQKSDGLRNAEIAEILELSSGNSPGTKFRINRAQVSNVIRSYVHGS